MLNTNIVKNLQSFKLSLCVGEGPKLWNDSKVATDLKKKYIKQFFLISDKIQMFKKTDCIIILYNLSRW